MWVAVDKDGREKGFNDKPIRYRDSNSYKNCIKDFGEEECGCFEEWTSDDYEAEFLVFLPNGTIKLLLNKELTWKDEAVEVNDLIK